MKLRTKRLILIPLDAEQMRLRANGDEKLFDELSLASGEDAPDEHLLGAYGEMCDNCEREPGDILWNTDWLIVLSGERRVIGSIGFKGAPDEKYTAEVGYGIASKYRNNGYASEALAKICAWAFGAGAYYVTAQTEPDNIPSQKVLGNCGFLPDGEGEEGLSFILEKPKVSWIAICTCLGMSIGLSLGLVYNRMFIITCIGIALGILAGVTLDLIDKKHRKKEDKNK